MYNGTSGVINNGPFSGREELGRNGIWNTANRTILGDLFQAATAERNEPVLTSSYSPVDNTVLANPDPSDDSGNETHRRGPFVPSVQSLFQGGNNTIIADTGAGSPMPWEASFPGGGSSSAPAIVNSNTGNRLTIPIYSFSVRGGMELGLTLYHNSRREHWDAYLGKKWSTNLDTRLQTNYTWGNQGTGRTITLTWGDGTPIPYEYDANKLKFVPPAGFYDSIKEETGSSPVWVLTTRTGTKYRFVAPSSDPLKWQRGALQTVYTYDAASNVLTYANSTAGFPSESTTYGYDSLNQLISEVRSGYTASYSYDNNGNRVTRTVNGLTETYANDNADKLTGVTWAGGSKTFTHDAQGRRTSMTRTGPNAGTTNYVWDNESRLVSINGQTTASYTYNGMDARVTAVDGQNRTFRRDGASVTSPVLSDGQATYTPGISERRSGTSRFMHSGLKNAESRTVSSTAIESVRTYDAFGNVLSTAGSSWSGAFGYAGGFGYQEDPSGLKLLGHRYYDSETGRFISRDFIEAGRNRYAYCDNNPLKRVDPNGLDWHNPNQVTVDPNFKGKVFVVGEPGPGQDQVLAEIKPGYQSARQFDCDIVIVVYPDGTKKRYFAGGVGRGHLDYRTPDQTTIGANGEVTGFWVVDIDDSSFSIENYMTRKQKSVAGFEDDIRRAKSRPVPAAANRSRTPPRKPLSAPRAQASGMPPMPGEVTYDGRGRQIIH
jgi:RHS repeat-associated protein